MKQHTAKVKRCFHTFAHYLFGAQYYTLNLGDDTENHDTFIQEYMLPVLMQYLPRSWHDLYMWVNIAQYIETYAEFGPEERFYHAARRRSH